ncbi:MAG TPA: carboxypeptidase-like regulatory domain-containing protein, partial [Nannocystis sp.]
LGPELARRMGIRAIVRPAGENFGNRRAAVALDLPTPTVADTPPGPADARLPAGLWRIEATAPGFLPSTREFTVDATTPEQTLRWNLLPDSAHDDVRFVVSATGTPQVSVRVRSADGARTWTCLSQRSACVLRLTPGEWHAEASAPGFRTTRRSFTVVRGAPSEVTLELVAGSDDLASATGPKGQIPANLRKRLALGLGLSAAPVFAAGIGLTLTGRLQYVSALHGDACEGSYRVGCGDAAIGPSHRASAGVGLLGAAAGLIATGLTGLYPVPRTAWYVELGLGGALTVAGIGWITANSAALERAHASGPITELAARADRRLAPSVFIGLGVGTLAGALTGLLVQRKAGRVAPYAGSGQAGLLWYGRF